MGSEYIDLVLPVIRITDKLGVGKFGIKQVLVDRGNNSFHAKRIRLFYKSSKSRETVFSNKALI